MSARVTELLANPPGADRGGEWAELCADASGASLGDYALGIGTRRVGLSGSLAPWECRIARTGSATLRNREPEVILLYKGAEAQRVRAAGTAPEGHGWHVVGEAGFWATSTPGAPSEGVPGLPPLPQVHAAILPGLLGTAACTAGILTATALAVLRHARDRHHARQGRDAAARG